MQKDISLILPSQKDLGALYISDIRTAQTLSWLKEQKIEAVLTVVRDKKLSHLTEDIPRYLCLPAQDRENFNISQYFEISTSFIAQSRRHTNVLVHCIAGISRSATIIAAYLINNYGHSPQSAISLLQEQRPKISPNKGFRMQLQNITTGLSHQKTEEAAINQIEIKNMPLQGSKQVEMSLKHVDQKNTERKAIRISFLINKKIQKNSLYIEQHNSRPQYCWKSRRERRRRKRLQVNREEKAPQQIRQLVATYFQRISEDTNTNQPTATGGMLQSKIHQDKIGRKQWFLALSLIFSNQT